METGQWRYLDTMNEQEDQGSNNFFGKISMMHFWFGNGKLPYHFVGFSQSGHNFIDLNNL
jgi:hypothetical protein